MNILALDCSTQACSAAVRGQGRMLARRFVLMERGQAEAMVPMAAAVMDEAGLAWGALDLIGVTVGPGSFTGLRIGLAAARAMGLAAGLAVAGVTTFDAAAAAVDDRERQGRTLMVAIDGKRDDIFIQLFDEQVRPLGAPAAMLPADAARLVEGPLVIAGDGADLVLAHRPDALAARHRGPVDAALVAALAEIRFATGQHLPPLPLYLRPPDVTPGPS